MSKEVAVSGTQTALRVFNSDTNLALVQQAIAENVGVGGVSEFDFERIKIPAGGGPMFTINTLEGETAEKTITAVIILARDSRGYWAKSPEDGGGNAPPDCHSNDGITGIGTPAGNCQDCPLAEFGSATKGGKNTKGQACKAMRQLFLLTGGSLLPVVLTLPPTSLKAAKQYMLRLAGQGVPYWGVVTRIGLEQATNEANQKYSKATFAFVSKLDDDQRAKARAYSEMLKPLVANMPVDTTVANQQ